MRWSVFLGIVVCIVLSGIAWAEDPVHFDDARLKAVVEAKLGFSNPTPRDMGAFLSLDASGQGITSLVGLEYASNMTALNAQDNQISSVSPLLGLDNLQQIILSDNNVTDLTPLCGLDNLRSLTVRSNGITSVPALTDLPRLHTLQLGSNEITTVGDLSALTSLKLLQLTFNNVSDLSFLDTVSADVTWLRLAVNQFSDISPITRFSRLETCEVHVNPLNQDAYCTHLPAIHSNSPGVDLYFDPNPGPVTVLAASQGTYPDQVVVTWDALCPGPGKTVYYQVYSSPTAEGEMHLVAGPQTGTTYVDTGIGRGKRRYYAIQSAESNRWYLYNDFPLSATVSGYSAISYISYYDLTISSEKGGSVTMPGEGVFTHSSGTVVMIQAMPQTDYHFTGWTGTAVTAGKVRNPAAASTRVTVDADYTLVAGFVGQRCKLDVSSTAGGSVATPGEGVFFYDHGQIITLEAQAEEGYHFSGWSGDVHTSSNPATVEMNADREVTANFVTNELAVTVSSGAGGSVVVPGEGLFVCAADPNVSVVALPEAGYIFTGWTGTAVDTGAVADSSVARVDFTAETSAALHANFAPAARCLYVDDDAARDPSPYDVAVGDPAENGTWDHPFDAIQEAIDAAADGDAVLVLAGTYRENIRFAGKRITVSAFDLSEFGAVSETIIVGTGADSVVVFEAGETAASILTGFTITGGQAELGGGIRCDGADPIIAHCLIVGNRADLGGGVYCRQSRAILANCTVADNYSWLEGGGLYSDGEVTVINSILHGNGPEQIAAAPGQVPGVTYSAVWDGWPGEGNLDGDPRFVEPGHWSVPGGSADALDPGDPEAVWVSGDYHLKAREGHWNGWMWLNDGVTSACVDAGNPDADVRWEPLPNGNRINLGAFGGTAEASQSSSDTAQQ